MKIGYMYKVLYTVVFLLAVNIVSSCTKSEGGEYIQDNWVRLQDVPSGWDYIMLSDYVEFGEDGVMTEFKLPQGQWARHYDGDPHLYVREDAEWKTAATYNYSLDGDRLSKNYIPTTV
ncbi:MAG: hypothetical protein J5699_05500 [Bacteroidales bacterium]|nr:hypothetical protein [Bacteroidales bacterium]